MKYVNSLSGAFTGFIATLPGTIAFGTVVYAPLGDEWLANGILACLVSHVIAGVTSAASSSSKELIIGPRSFSVVIFSTLIAAVYIELSPNFGQSYAAGSAVVACILVGSLSGLIQIILGIFRLEKLVQFIPSQVVSVIMNVTAIMVLASQIPRALGVDGDPWSTYFYTNIGSSNPDSILLAFATIALMFVLPKKLLGIPSSLISLGFGIGLSIILKNFMDNFSVKNLPSIKMSDYFLVTDFSPDTFLRLFENWNLIGLISIASISLAVLNTLSLLIAGKSINMYIDRKADQNRDLISGGFSNILISLMGSIPSTAKMGASKIAIDGNSKGAQLAWLVSGFYALVIVIALPYLDLVPVAVLAAISVVLSVRLIDSKARGVFKRLKTVRSQSFKSDCVYLFTIFAVLTTAILHDFIQAIVIGVIITIIDFLIKISKFQIDTINGEKRRSRTHRTMGEDSQLDENMSKLVILDISGFILFPVAETLKKKVDDAVHNACEYVIFDFHDVHYVDETGCLFLSKLIEELRRRKLEVFITQQNFDYNPWLYNTEWDLFITKLPESTKFKFLDDALLVVEEKILQNFNSKTGSEGLLINSDLFKGLTECEFKIASHHFTELTALPGSLLDCDEDNSTLFLIVDGTVEVSINTADGTPLRLFTFKNGAVVGEISFIDNSARSAALICTTDTKCLKLTRPHYLELQKKNAAVAGKLMENIATILSNRLRRTNTLLQDAY